MRKKTALLIVAFLVPLLIAYWQVYREWRPDIVRDGVADMRTTFSSDRVFFFCGQWEYYPGKLIAPGQFGEAIPEFVNVPVALGNLFSGRVFSQTVSVGTYRLRLLLPASTKRMEFDTYMIRSADRIYINGEEVVEQGRVTTRPEKFVAFSRPAKAAFDNRGDNEIVIQVADYCIGADGIIAAPSFSSEANALNQHRKEMFSDEAIVLSGALVFFILAGMFLQRNRQRELVYFVACLSAVVLIFALSYDRLLFDFFPGLDYELAMRIKVICGLTAFLFVVQYFLLALEAKALLGQINVCCEFLFIVLALLAPGKWIVSLYVMIMLPLWCLSLFGGLAVLLVRAYINNISGAVYLVFGFSGFFTMLIESLFRVVGYISTPYTVALLFPMILISQLLFLSERHRKKQLDESLRASEMRSLRSQMNTHFVYNALAAIAGMIKTEPGQARRTLVDFSNFFRKLIKPAHSDYDSTMQEELELVRYYINVELVRFEQRLTVVVDVPDELLGLAIPALVIQPLVENSIKHNFEKSAVQMLKLAITARRLADTLVIEICDNGTGMTADQIRLLNKGNTQGIGLKNISERLRAYDGQLNFSYCERIMKATLLIKIIREDQNA